MQTGTVETSNASYKPYSLTIILLCLGYFIDFYDLTIFSASYNNIIKDLFHIYATAQIQLLYLKITNYYTVGIILGGLTCGILGDKFGRSTVIRYSILLYSVAILASIFAHSIQVFTLLRFLSGAGLAAEFALSSVLISELLPSKLAAKSTAWLYASGVLGGISATLLSAISWKIMFLGGGIAGLILYLVRKKLIESQLFLHVPQTMLKGQIWQLFNGWPNCLKILKLFILITPFYFLISIMFIYPNFMPLKVDLAQLIRMLLIGFFLGNLISTLFSSYIVNKFKDYRIYLLISSLSFGLIMSLFGLINQKLFFYYAITLGLLGGGHPTVWIQMVAKSYGTNQRSTATNTLYVLGRSSSIIFNLLISTWLVKPQNFTYYCLTTILAITLISLITLMSTSANYATNTNYLEKVN